jgi:hypothetical protein
MDWHAAALDVAGVIGIGVAVVHGLLVQRLMVRPIEAAYAAGVRMSRASRQLVPALLQFSTYNWFLGGLALIAAANGFPPGARLATGLLVGSSYLFGAVGNLIATRGRHPGWALYAAAVGLIAYGVA